MYVHFTSHSVYVKKIVLYFSNSQEDASSGSIVAAGEQFGGL
jgi:hypothetical protein